jgi:hypothetical protein
LVLLLPQSGIQYYDAEKLHNRPHYMTTKPISSLKRLYGFRSIKMIKPLTTLTANDILFDQWDALKNLVEAEAKKVNVRGNIVLLKGFSGQAKPTALPFYAASPCCFAVGAMWA